MNLDNILFSNPNCYFCKDSDFSFLSPIISEEDNIP